MILCGRGAGRNVLLSLALSACVTTSPEPSASGAAHVPLASPASLAADSVAILAGVAAYDYALAGSFAGERVRVVTPDRYAAALAGQYPAIAALKDKVMRAAFAQAALAGALVEVADADVRVSEDLQLFADSRDDVSFARTVQDVEAAWSALRRLAALLPRDDALGSSLARGASWSVTVSRAPAFAVVTAPYATREEAVAAARRIGSVEQIATTSPFTIRVLTTADRGAADRRAGDLRDGGIVAATLDTERLSFSRAGPDPLAELWREPALDIPTQEGARRANFVAGGTLVVSVDGYAYAFGDTGTPRWRVRLNAGPTFVTAARGGQFLAVGGQFVQVVTNEGQLMGTAGRLPSSAAAAVWVERRAVFVAASQGPTGKPEGGGGAVTALNLNGKVLSAPFPLVTPAAGPALAASPARDEVYIATTSKGATDIEAIRPGIDEKTRALARVDGQVADLIIDDAGTFAVLVTASGTYRFRPGTADPGATMERIGATARDVAFDPDGTLYAVFADRLVAYDTGLRQRWSATLSDGRRVLAGRRVVVQDGLRRVVVADRGTGATDELASVGEIDDVAVSQDGARVLVLVDGRRAVVFQLP
ncbi:MAG: hypothetical protein AUH85_02070 [Chloroflexi bacterium 13_1_40CM_4_68_4]|nr:MAG: hypothetical protein AUH85_02070 [Chloroflexi bacterium 13_1_40CM_4_68_4]